MLKRARFSENLTTVPLACEHLILRHCISNLRAHAASDIFPVLFRLE